MKIEFILHKEVTFDNKEVRRSVGLDHPPKPATKFISEEYKNLINYTDNDLRKPTVKKCVPFLDAMTCGYIIPFFQDHLITVDHEKKEWHVHVNFNNPKNHTPRQLPKNYQASSKIEQPIGKFSNKWVIKTPPGYSCLFIHPMNTPKTDFEIIPGVVDTDTFEDTVFFPYYFRRYEESKGMEQVLLKLGTPMVQVVPFKRERWKSEVKMHGDDEIPSFTGHLVDFYKKVYWRKKHYD